MKRYVVAFLCVAITSPLWSAIDAPIEITETDGGPSTFPYKIMFSTGSVTDNGDGTISVNVGGGSPGAGLPAGSQGNVQYNDGGFFGGASFFNIHASSSTTSADMLWTSSSVGPVLTDASLCTWRATITTAGNIVTTLISCPAVVASAGCRGQPVGLLAAITCAQ